MCDTPLVLIAVLLFVICFLVGVLVGAHTNFVKENDRAR